MALCVRRKPRRQVIWSPLTKYGRWRTSFNRKSCECISKTRNILLYAINVCVWMYVYTTFVSMFYLWVLTTHLFSHGIDKITSSNVLFSAKRIKVESVTQSKIRNVLPSWDITRKIVSQQDSNTITKVSSWWQKNLLVVSVQCIAYMKISTLCEIEIIYKMAIISQD